MFEDSVFASRRQQRNGRTGWAVAGALGAQAVVMAALVIVPMLRPEVLPMVSAAPIVDLVALRKVVLPKVEVRPKTMMVANSGFNAPSASAPPVIEGRAGGSVMRFTPGMGTDEPALTTGGPGMGSGSGLLPAGMGSGAGEPVVVVRPAPARVRISIGVSSGMLLAPIRVVYPAIAKAAHLEGTVVVTATIDKTGRIVGVQVTSGPAMLRAAAVDAVKEARYRPFLLNGEATEVETTVQVNFRLGS